MQVAVLTAGFEEGYHWQPSSPCTSLTPEVTAWHQMLCEEDGIFALVAGCSQGSWSIEFRNLLLPGIIDFRGRQITLNIIFSELSSEKDVRALALAYLDINVQEKKGIRYCPELAAAYTATPEGSYHYDFSAAKDWAETSIARYKNLLGFKNAEHKMICRLQPSDTYAVEQLRQHILSYSLQHTDGLRLLWAELYANTKLPADFILTCTNEHSTWEKAPFVDEENRTSTNARPLQEAIRRAKPHLDEIAAKGSVFIKLKLNKLKGRIAPH